MAEPTFSERRTRSQLTLPDNVLHIPERSPLKDARTTLRNHIAVPSDVRSAKDDSDDELLLSPRKKEVWMEPTGKAKRSASPPLHDEYSAGPSDDIGRELKRVRRDPSPTANVESDIENVNGTRPLGHTRNHSEPNVAKGRRSSRKRSATTNKKPNSTVSASPTPTTFSPAPKSPSQGRAQSVPLFSTVQDMLRIDFRNPPPSPKRKRSRSRSRSPSKDRELKLRITSLNVAIPPKLPTIHAGIVTDISTSDAESSVPEERELLPAPSTSSTEIISTSASLPNLPQPMPNPIPATPAPHSLNRLIPMSPLTPLPETPFPGRTAANADAQDGLKDDGESIIEPIRSLESHVKTHKPPATVVASASTSRLPRPSVAPPLLPAAKLPRPPIQGSAVISKKPMVAGPSNGVSGIAKKDASSGAAAKPNAFDMMMKRAQDSKAEHDKGKGKEKAKVRIPAKVASKGVMYAPIVNPPKKPDAAEPSKRVKTKLRDKMRKKEKPEAPKKGPILEPLPDSDEEEDQLVFQNATMPVAAEEAMVAAPVPPLTSSPSPPRSPPRVSPQPFVDAPVIVTEDVIMSDEIQDNTAAEDQVKHNSAMEELEIPTSDEGERDYFKAEVKDNVQPDLPMEELEIPTSQEYEQVPSNVIVDGKTGDVIPETSTSIPPPVPATPPPDIVPETVSTIVTDIPMEEGQNSLEGAVQPCQDSAALDLPEHSKNQAEVEEEVPTASQPPSAPSKLPYGKKRQPISVAPPARVTRSVSLKNNGKEVGGSQHVPITGVSRKKATIIAKAPAPTKRTLSGTLKKSAVPKPVTCVETSIRDIPMDTAEDAQERLPPGSPMKLSSPVKTSPYQVASSSKTDDRQTIKYGAGTLTLAKTPTKSLSSNKPASSPSPSKIGRSSTLLYKQPSAPGVTRSFSSSQIQSGPGSSLSTLSNALEKLRMPPPARPNTSMGFNRDVVDDHADIPRTKDDFTIGRGSLGLGRVEGGVKRSTTLGAGSFKSTTTTAITNATASSSKSSTSGGNMVQKPLSMFMSSKGAAARPKGSAIRPPGKLGPTGNRPSIFGVGGAVRRTISKKSTLPVVIGSPVKGGNPDEVMLEENEEGEDDEESGGQIFNAIVNGSSATLLLENLLAQGPEKGMGKEKERETSIKASHSRRVSMLSRDLSQSLNAPPPPPNTSGRGLMGPPATPPSAGRTSTRSTSGSPSQGSTTGATRYSARIAKSAPGALTKIKGGTNGHVSSGRKGAEPAPAPNPAVEALQVLKDCVIFVDVKTDDGDEAGTLFVEMLEGVGARVLTRVGQTCTHIVFKNGLASTTTRYRLLRDPKPFVVGIGWVVECVEQRKHVDETEFLVDLEHTNLTGANKRRRSMLPKLLYATESSTSADAERDDDGDHSVDGSVSSVTMDDGLAPLERARRRKSMMIGLHPS